MIEEVKSDKHPFTVEPADNGVVVVPYWPHSSLSGNHTAGMKVFNSHADFCAWAEEAFTWKDAREYIFLEPEQLVQTAHVGSKTFEAHHCDGARTVWKRTDRRRSGMPVFESGN